MQQEKEQLSRSHFADSECKSLSVLLLVKQTGLVPCTFAGWHTTI